MNLISGVYFYCYSIRQRLISFFIRTTLRKIYIVFNIKHDKLYIIMNIRKKTIEQWPLIESTSVKVIVCKNNSYRYKLSAPRNGWYLRLSSLLGGSKRKSNFTVRRLLNLSKLNAIRSCLTFQRWMYCSLGPKRTWCQSTSLRWTWAFTTWTQTRQERNTLCPSCLQGILSLALSRYSPFLICVRKFGVTFIVCLFGGMDLEPITPAHVLKLQYLWQYIEICS